MRVAPGSDDPVVLKRLLAEQRVLTNQPHHERDTFARERDALREQADTYQAQLEARDAEALNLRTQIEALKLQITKLKRLKFGQSSEKYDAQIGQLELILEDLETTQAQRATLTPADQIPVRQPAKRKPLPEHPGSITESCVRG